MKKLQKDEKKKNIEIPASARFFSFFFDSSSNIFICAAAIYPQMVINQTHFRLTRIDDSQIKSNYFDISFAFINKSTYNQLNF